MNQNHHPVFRTPLPPNWEVLSVDEVKSSERSSCVAGPFGSDISSKYFVADGIPVIRGSNLTNDLTKFVSDSFVFVSEEQARRYPAQHVKVGDLVFTCWGTIGQVGLIPEDGPYDEYIISNKQLKLRPDSSRANPLFLFYYFSSPAMVEYIRNRAIGSAVPGINLGILKSLPVVLPPLGVQRKIAAVLGAYDDLIENNNRRIKLLEEMAQRIYREWFVDFRYPGHEAVPLADSQLGLIPVGWDIGLLKDLVDVNVNTIRGSGTDESIDYIDISSVERGTVKATKRMMLSEAPGRARRRVSDGDILWSTVRPNLCAYALVLEPKGNCIASTGFAVLSPRHASFAYIYALSTTDAFVEYLNGRATGSAYPAVTSSIFENAPVLLPPKDILRTFAENVEPHFRLASLLAKKSEILRSARDLLTPRLISGEIDVTDLDIALAETAA